jgi:hypothetical protein
MIAKNNQRLDVSRSKLLEKLQRDKKWNRKSTRSIHQVQSNRAYHMNNCRSNVDQNVGA